MATEDKQAFVAALATRHGQRLRRFLAARLQNVADVPDLAQEVFLRMLRIQSHESIRSPEAYLLTVAAHVIHQHALREAAAPEAADLLDSLVDAEWCAQPDPSESLEVRQNLDALVRTLSELPRNIQACFILQRLYGYSLDEIGAEVGIARSTVKKYLVRALTHCQRRLVPPSKDAS